MIKASDVFEFDLKACDWTPDGNYLVIGGEKGVVYSVNATSLQQINMIKSKMAAKNDKCWIEDIKVSPSGQKVVFGTHGGLSYIEVASIKADG